MIANFLTMDFLPRFQVNLRFPRFIFLAMEILCGTADFLAVIGAIVTLLESLLVRWLVGSLARWFFDRFGQSLFNFDVRFQ